MQKQWLGLMVTAAISSSVLVGCGSNDSDNSSVVVPTPKSIEVKKIGRFETNLFDEGASEIPAFDAISKRTFVVNAKLKTVQVLDLADPSNPKLLNSIDIADLGGSVNSVAVYQGVVALAIESSNKQANGKVAFYKAQDLSRISVVEVGALPDMLTFSPNGKLVVVANEGEPNDDYSVDPVGSVSVIDVSDLTKPIVRSAGFAQFNNQIDSLRNQGIRIFGKNASVAQDLEPEYVTVSSDSKTAWVTLQENNAIAEVDLVNASITALRPLGYKDHSKVGSGLDASDKDSKINIKTWPILGMYQPDAIGNYQVASQTYLVMSNEGDAREYGDFAEETRIKDLLLDPAVFTATLCGGNCQDEKLLGRLNVTNTLGFSTNAEGQKVYSKLYSFGARSFSIRKPHGTLVFDSGDQLEQLAASKHPATFNASHDDNKLDSRSDNKGVEPEGLALGQLGNKTFAFVGLERDSGIAVYDISTPAAPTLAQYVTTRDFTQDVKTSAAGDLGPEGLVFVPAAQSPNGKPLLIVGYEISGSTVIYQIDQQF